MLAILVIRIIKLSLECQQRGKEQRWENMSSSGVLLVTVTVIGNIEGNYRYQGEHTSLFQTSELESALG